jgi:hypothetical protein
VVSNQRLLKTALTHCGYQKAESHRLPVVLRPADGFVGSFPEFPLPSSYVVMRSFSSR